MMTLRQFDVELKRLLHRAEISWDSDVVGLVQTAPPGLGDMEHLRTQLGEEETP